MDASAVIWIASKFTDEHKKALDWLNDHTSDEISFYGLQLELWQIGRSEPAVKFNVVSQPNRAVRQASKRKNQGDLSIQEDSTRVLDCICRYSGANRKIRSIQTPRLILV